MSGLKRNNHMDTKVVFQGPVTIKSKYYPYESRIGFVYIYNDMNSIIKEIEDIDMLRADVKDPELKIIHDCSRKDFDISMQDIVDAYKEFKDGLKEE